MMKKKYGYFGFTLRHSRAETSWSNTPKAITGSDVKKTLYNDRYQSLYAAWPENAAYTSKKKIVKPKAMFL
jgi:hypothetical protein